MKTGISLYPGLHGTAEEHVELLEKAADAGIGRVFTSLHIPETDTAALRRELRALLQTARRRGLDVVADISPKTAAILGIDSLQPQQLLELGITTARLDYGFDVRKTALFSRVLSVQLNASTVQPEYIDALRDAGADFSRIDCLHNFYPRPHTGLSEAFFTAQTARLQQVGLSVGAFIPSQHGRRGPLFEGLPTLEDHRCLDVSLTARHLAALGVQSVFIGDAQPSDAELEALAAAGREEKGVVVLKTRLCSREPWVRDFLSYTFTSRLDPSRDMIRTQESRSHASGSIVRDEACPRRGLRRGDVTIDTDMYLRYRGEAAIMTADAEEDDKTMIAAQILPEERFLLKYITPGRRFRLEFVR